VYEAYWANEGSSFHFLLVRATADPTFARRGELGLNTSNQPKCKVEDQQSCDAGYLLQGRRATRTTNKHAPAQCLLHCLPALCLLLGQSTHMLCTARQDVCSTGVPLLFTSASTNTTDTQLNQPYPPACRAALVPNPVSPASRLTGIGPSTRDRCAQHKRGAGFLGSAGEAGFLHRLPADEEASVHVASFVANTCTGLPAGLVPRAQVWTCATARVQCARHRLGAPGVWASDVCGYRHVTRAHATKLLRGGGHSVRAPNPRRFYTHLPARTPASGAREHGGRRHKSLCHRHANHPSSALLWLHAARLGPG